MATPPILSGRTIPYRATNNEFLPTQVGSGSLQLWLDSSDINVGGVRPVEGQVLNSWNDKSGLGNNVTGGSIKPIYQAGGVYFSGGAGFTTALSDSLANETIFIVVEYSGSTIDGQSLLYPGSSGGRLFSIRNNTLLTKRLVSEILLSYGTTSSTNINLVCSLRNNLDTSVTHFVDGSNVGNFSATYSGSGISYLGTDNYAGTISLTGTIYEVICYNSALSSVERQQVESYLAWKWNIKLNTFLPNQLPNLEIWLDSKDLAQNGTAVSTWPNKSSIPYTITSGVGVGGVKPITTSTGVYFTDGAGFDTDYITNSLVDETVFIVFQYSGAVTEQYIFFTNDPTGRKVGVDTNVLKTIGSTTLTGGATTSNSLVLITTRNTVANPSYEHFVNGIYATATASMTYDETSGMLIGTDNYIGTRSLNGYISEIIIYNTSLSDTDRETVENYLAVKWNLNRVLSSVLPTSISGLQIWVDATDVNGDGTAYTNNTLVSTWSNKSSSGIEVKQTNSSYQPTYLNNGILFNKTTGFTTTYKTSSNETVFAVLTANSNILMNILYPSVAGNRTLSIQSSKLNTTTTSGGLGNGNISVSNITLITTLNNTTNIFHYINGNSNSGGTSGTTPNTGTTYIGIDDTYNAGFIGTINELIIYNTALSTSDRQDIEEYLTKKWIPSPSNLPISHPYYYNNVSANTPYILSAIPRSLNGSNTFNSNNYPLISNNFSTRFVATYKSFT